MVNSINSGYCYIHPPPPGSPSLLLPSLKDKPCPGPYSGLIGMKIYLPEAGTSQHLKEEGREGCLERKPEAEGAGNSLGEGRKGSEANPPPSLQLLGSGLSSS